MTVLLFLIHRLCGDFRELQKGLLISFPEDHVLVFILFFEIQIRRAALVDDPLDVVGGPVQDLSNFQMAPIPILSVLTCSTS